MHDVPIPRGLVEGFDGQPQARDWLLSLPAAVAQACSRWRLRVDLAQGASPWHGVCAIVVPVRTSDDAPAALKVCWPHDEAEHEGLALDTWAGDGAVRLLRTDGEWTHLLERLDAGRDLTAVPVQEALEVAGTLMRRLRVPAPTGLGLLSVEAAKLADRLALAAARATDSPVPNRLFAAALDVLGTLLAEPRDGTLLHTDLHYFNVLAAEREPWLAIDPKPISGDPAYEVAPLLWNRWPEAVATGDPGAESLRRAAIACAAAGLDPDRAGAWVLVREVQNALYCLDQNDSDGLAVHLTIAQAVA